MPYGKLIIIFAILWFTQVYFALKQRKAISRLISDLKQKHQNGYLGVGVARSRFNFGSGVITVILTDDKDQIVAFEAMQGISVFARFKSQTAFMGQKADDVSFTAKEMKLEQSFNSALDQIKTAQLNLNSNYEQ